MIWCKHTWYAHLRSIETDLTMIQNKTQSGIEAQPFGPAGTMSQYVRVIFWNVCFGTLRPTFPLHQTALPGVSWTEKSPILFIEAFNWASNEEWGHRPCVRFTRGGSRCTHPWLACFPVLRWAPWMVLEKRWERMKLMRGYGRSLLRNTLWIMESLGPGWYVVFFFGRIYKDFPGG